MIPGWAFLLAAAAVYPLVVAFFGGAVATVLDLPDPEEDEPHRDAVQGRWSSETNPRTRGPITRDRIEPTPPHARRVREGAGDEA